MAVSFSLLTLATAQQPVSSQSIHLWPKRAPLAVGDTDADTPRLDVYLPTTNPTHTGVVICPGGSYHYLALDYEGSHVAKWLMQHGVAAFVLHYRVAPYQYPVPMLDGERAMRIVRSRASEFNIAVDHIGVWGFSAGGHLASFLMTHFDQNFPGISETVADSVDATNSRPDFGILAYAVISMTPGTTHAGSHENLLGKVADAKLETYLSNELNVSRESPPAFLFATSDDPVVPVSNSVLFYQAYIVNHRPVEMHLIEHGPHGVGLAENLPGGAVWPDLLAGWMSRHGWMASLSVQ